MTSKTSVAPMDRGGHQPLGYSFIARMACATSLRCLGVWMDTQCTLGAVEPPVAARWPSQCCWQHPRPLLIRPWRDAVSPRVALPPRPWDGQRHQAAWSCLRAPSAACLPFLPSSSLRQLRTATSKTFVAPLDRARRQAGRSSNTNRFDDRVTAKCCLRVLVDLPSTQTPKIGAV